MSEEKSIRMSINVCPLLQPNLYEFLCNQDRREHSTILKRIVEDGLISRAFDATKAQKKPFKIEVSIDKEFYPASHDLIVKSPKLKRAKKFTALAEEWNIRFDYESIKITDTKARPKVENTDLERSVLDDFDIEKINSALENMSGEGW